MARDHRTLRVFHDAHRLTLAIYKHTKNLPKDEWYGLRAPIRKASVSIPRTLLKEVHVARASGAEVAYLVQLTDALEILSKSSFAIKAQSPNPCHPSVCYAAAA
jgi:23S rRNA-intervening sequence protein